MNRREMSQKLAQCTRL